MNVKSRYIFEWRNLFGKVETFFFWPSLVIIPKVKYDDGYYRSVLTLFWFHRGIRFLIFKRGIWNQEKYNAAYGNIKPGEERLITVTAEKETKTE